MLGLTYMKALDRDNWEATRIQIEEQRPFLRALVWPFSCAYHIAVSVLDHQVRIHFLCLIFECKDEVQVHIYGARLRVTERKTLSGQTERFDQRDASSERVTIYGT